MAKYVFKVKRASDGVITHMLYSDDLNFQPEIQKGWNLENNHQVIREEIAGPTYDILRKDEILAEWPVHEQFEALTENMMGRPDKLQNLLSFIQSVKTKYPKPQGVQ